MLTENVLNSLLRVVARLFLCCFGVVSFASNGVGNGVRTNPVELPCPKALGAVTYADCEVDDNVPVWLKEPFPSCVSSPDHVLDASSDLEYLGLRRLRKEAREGNLCSCR